MDASPLVLLDNSLTPGGASYLFSEPDAIVVCTDPDQVANSLEKISKALSEGFYAAGYLSYELGYLLEPKLRPLFPTRNDQPLIWMGLFKERKQISEKEAFEFVSARAGAHQEPPIVENLSLSMSKEAYLSAFQKAQDYISAGDVYQINLTLKYLFEFSANPFALYQELRRKQKVAFGGIIQAEEFNILSLSPELFFLLEDGTISSRPMKGTAPRGLTTKNDKKIADWLSTDIKSRAENLMIVDLLRNDLGRIAEIGSVEVTDLFTVEDYRTVLQMTSGIKARLKPDLQLTDILNGIFPCGSVTGAPKVRAMEIISELETEPRGVYTGAVGMIAPNGDAVFNVAIRTLFLNNDGTGEMGIGSGVVADSEAEAEFEECLLKAHFLTEPDPAFDLIETLRYQDGKGYYLLDRHLARLKDSAGHFGFPFSEEAVIEALNAEAEKLKTPTHMVRLLLDERGGITTSNIPIELPAEDTIWRFALSDKSVDQDDIAFYHKTTKRDLYTAEYNRYHKQYGTDDVVFVNKRGELTEGSRTNIFIKKGDTYFTPPVSCGLLPGTLREEMLQSTKMKVEQKVLTLDDLEAAGSIYLGNSVRGLVRSEWVNKP